MTTQDRDLSSTNTVRDGAGSTEGIKPQGWSIIDPGARVSDATGTEIGTVRETLDSYLHVKVHENLLTDVEMYIPRELIREHDAEKVQLRATVEELHELNLTTPPALR